MERVRLRDAEDDKRHEQDQAEAERELSDWAARLGGRLRLLAAWSDVIERQLIERRPGADAGRQHDHRK